MRPAARSAATTCFWAALTAACRSAALTFSLVASAFRDAVWSGLTIAGRLLDGVGVAVWARAAVLAVAVSTTAARPPARNRRRAIGSVGTMRGNRGRMLFLLAGASCAARTNLGSGY